jgi:hypothetical protein
MENDAVRFEVQFTEFSKQANEPFRRMVATTEKIGIPLGRYVSGVQNAEFDMAGDI